MQQEKGLLDEIIPSWFKSNIEIWEQKKNKWSLNQCQGSKINRSQIDILWLRPDTHPMFLDTNSLARRSRDYIWTD